LCVQRSLKVGGNKSVLVARLLDDGVMPQSKQAPKQAKTAAGSRQQSADNSQQTSENNEQRMQGDGDGDGDAAPCPAGVSPELFTSLDTQVVAAGL
jgi:hypothetical protein